MKDRSDKFSYTDPKQIKILPRDERKTPAGVPVDYENAIRKKIWDTYNDPIWAPESDVLMKECYDNGLSVDEAVARFVQEWNITDKRVR